MKRIFSMERETCGVSALSLHFMVIIDGSVHTWGLNEYGQLGDGTTIDKNKPNKIQNLDNVVSVAWGKRHSMALTQDGDVYLWGCNENGELGDGTTTNSTTPKKLNTLNNIKMIACSDDHNSMLITNDGDVYSWGKNIIGQLGNGSTNQSTTPNKINNLTNIATISCGYQYSIAISEKGDVYSWGLNNYGQLGNGSTTNSTVPQKIKNFTNVTTIACGSGHALALMSCGDVYSWGRNYLGQLGNGHTNNTSTPQKIPNLVNIVAISCGYQHSMALTRDGDVYSWGWNLYGQLGVGSTTNSLTPLKVNITDNVCTITCVGHNSMVLTTSGHAFVWGYNSQGQLCNGTSTQSTTPQKLDLPFGTLQIPLLQSLKIPEQLTLTLNTTNNQPVPIKKKKPATVAKKPSPSPQQNPPPALQPSPKPYPTVQSSPSSQTIPSSTVQQSLTPTLPISQWNKQQVYQYMKQDPYFSSCAETFLKEDIDGNALIELEDKHLKELGISLGLRMKFSSFIKELSSVAQTPTADKTLPKLAPVPTPALIVPAKDQGTVVLQEERGNRCEPPTARFSPGKRFLDIIPKALATPKNVIEGLEKHASEDHLPLILIQNFKDKIEDFCETNTPEKAFAMALCWLYTTESWVYPQVNSLLRDDSSTMVALAPYMKALIQSYKNLEEDETNFYAGVVYRRTKLTPKGLEFYKPDLHFVWSAFTSTAIEFNPSGEFGNILFEITIPETFKKYALCLENVSAFPTEREVLMLPNIAYRVVAIENNSDQYPNTTCVIKVCIEYVCLVL